MDNILSVIIPVYNVENYLIECLDSLLLQTDQCFDVILIDDGSSDASGAICDRYEVENQNFKVIHKQNGGVSSARNVGIKAAKTRYITFIDSDDFIAKDYIANLIEPLRENVDVDFVQAGSQIYDEKTGKTEPCQKYDYYCGTDYLKVFNQFRGLAVSKIFVLDIIVSNKIFFDENVRFTEDYIFTLQYMYYVKKYCFVPEIGYFYRKLEHSVYSKYYNDYSTWGYIVKTKFDSIINYIKLHNISLYDSTKCIPAITGELSWLFFLLYHSEQQSKHIELSKLCHHYQPILNFLPVRQRLFAQLALYNCKLGNFLFFLSYKIENKVNCIFGKCK